MSLDQIFKFKPDDTYISIWVKPDHHLYIKSLDQLPKFPPDQDVYFAPALRNNKGDLKTDVFGTRVLWVDIDDADNKPLATIPPSFIVSSGGGYHYYWYLNEYEASTSRIEAANQVLIEDVKGDKACWNVNRFMRVPNTFNTRRSKLSHVVAASGNIYSLDVIDFLSKMPSKLRHKIRTGDRRGYKSRSELDWSVISDLISLGATFDFVHNLYKVTVIGTKYREHKDGEAYLRRTYEKAHAKPPTRSASKTARVASLPSGIKETGEGYFMTGARGSRPLSTFTLEPTQLLVGLESIKGGTESAIKCKVMMMGKVVGTLSVPRKAFNSRNEFDKLLHSFDWTWFGRDDDLRALQIYLAKYMQENNVLKTRATYVLGYHDGLFVGTKQTLDGENVFVGKDSPMLYTPRTSERPIVHYNGSGDKVDWIHLLVEINKPDVIWPIIGWYAACALKPLFEKNFLRFPILSLTGTRGSGKTSITGVMQSLIGYVEPINYDCVTTPFILRTLLGSTNAVPLAFQEYRSDVGERFMRYLRMLYDGGSDARGTASLDTVSYTLTSPVSVDGEDRPSDAAVIQRMISVSLSPKTIEEQTDPWRAFAELERKPLKDFALGFLQHTLKTDFKETLEAAKELVHRVFPDKVDNRPRKNYTVVTTGMLIFCAYTGIQMPSIRDVLETSLESVWSSKKGRSPLLVDEFVEAIVNGFQMKDRKFIHEYDHESNILWFQLSSTYEWWKEKKTRVRAGILDKSSLDSQLKERVLVDGEDTKGQYIVKPELRDKKFMYGISLDASTASGLDVPERLDPPNTVTVEF